MAYGKHKKRGNPSAASSMDKKFIDSSRATGPNTSVSPSKSVKGQDHLSQEQIKKPLSYKNA